MIIVEKSDSRPTRIAGSTAGRRGRGTTLDLVDGGGGFGPEELGRPGGTAAVGVSGRGGEGEEADDLNQQRGEGMVDQVARSAQMI